VLEVGAGEGGLAAWLAARVDYTGVEPDAQSRARAAARLNAIGRGRMLASLPQAGALRFDLVCAFEVLEHIDDAAAALRLWSEHTAPGGYLLISVPAHSSRFGASDRFVGHFRRYDRDGLARLLEANDYDVVRWTSYGAGLGHAIERLRNQLLKRTSTTVTPVEGTALSGRLYQPKSTLRVVLKYVVALPFRIAQAPFAATEIGIGYVVLARRREVRSTQGTQR
jgi:hypothetical protein